MNTLPWSEVRGDPSDVVTALGGVLFGFDTAVISGTTDALQNVFGLDPIWLGFTVATLFLIDWGEIVRSPESRVRLESRTYRSIRPAGKPDLLP